MRCRAFLLFLVLSASTYSFGQYNFIKQLEGLRLEPYKCGVWQIGWGHTEGVNGKTSRILRHDADSLFRYDIKTTERILSRHIKVPLEKNQKRALVSFIFNVGVRYHLKKGSKSSKEPPTWLQKLNRGDYQGCADEMLRWVYSGGKKMRGLVKRRQLERSMFLGIEIQPNSSSQRK